MLSALFCLTALLSGKYVLADQALTSPTNGTNVQPGGTFQLEWYTDDSSDVRQNATKFDVALISLAFLGNFTPSAGYVNETLTVPSNITSGAYYLGINYDDAEQGDDDDDDDDNDNQVRYPYDLDDYDVEFNEPNKYGDRYTIVNVTSSADSQTMSRRRSMRIMRRQLFDKGDDELLISPSNDTSVNNGSSFNFSYRVDGYRENTEYTNNHGSVKVGLIRYFTGLQRNNAPAPTTVNEGSYWNGTITIPTDIPSGPYYIGVFSSTSEDGQPRAGSYHTQFKTRVNLDDDNEIDINGNEKYFIIEVGNSTASTN